MKNYLIETALLSQGLRSISDDNLLTSWNYPDARLVWLEKGKVITGPLAAFLPVRQQANQLRRIDAASLADARNQKATGALTASATMAICQEMQIPLAVTCGMGGIGPRPAVTIGSDLIALQQWQVILIAAAPKDVFDLQTTLDWLRHHGVRIVGANNDICDGFLIKGPSYRLDGTITDLPHTPPLLILNGLAQRPVTTNELKNAMREGDAAVQQGGYYHPAVNQKLDEDTQGASSQEQLKGLLANIGLAERL